MPTAVELVGSAADAEYEARMSWTFKAKLADLADEEVYSLELKGMPLIGQWSLGVWAEGGKTVVSCSHGPLPEGALGAEVSVMFRLDILCDGQAKLLAGASREPGPLPDMNPESSRTYTAFEGQIDLDKIIKNEPWFEPLAKKSQTYSVTVSLQRSTNRPFVRGPTGPLANQASLLAVSDTDSSPMSKDACLVFPRARPAGLRLWSTVAFLRKASPYFKDVFDSGCIEAVPRRAKRLRKEDVKPIIDLMDDEAEDKNWDDSDDETDAYLARAGGAQPEDAELDVEYRQITIEETALTTYRAVLFYLKSGYIAFAPLRSSFWNPQPADEHASRTDFLLEHTEEKPELPLPASPKSVYRLAHLLGLEELQKLALASLLTSLTVSGAISELFSPASMAYDELRKILRDFVLEHLDAIRSNPAWKAQEAKANRGELEGPALVTMELLMAVPKTTEKRRT